MKCTNLFDIISTEIKKERKINMTTFKALVRNKSNGELTIIESDYETKGEFIQDLRGNGYGVNPLKVKTKELFDYIVSHTNCEIDDWKIKSI